MKSVFTAEYKAFLDTLISARKARNVTQQELAKRLKKPQSFVSKYERGERRLDVVEFVTIAQVIGLDPTKVVRDIEFGLLGKRKQKADQ